jgi:hypothetical protein
LTTVLSVRLRLGSSATTFFRCADRTVKSVMYKRPATLSNRPSTITA